MEKLRVKAAVQVVAVTNFIAVSSDSQKALSTANLLKSLTVNAIIIGEVGTGKSTLATTILPNAPIFDARNHNEILSSIDSDREVIVESIEHSSNITVLLNTFTQKNVRVIATSSATLFSEKIDEYFGLKINLTPLSQRPEDVKVLIEKFTQEICQELALDVSLNIDEPDLSQNSISLRKQIYRNSLLIDIDDKELMEIVEDYLADKIGSNNDYRNFLYLYEVPLIRAGLKKFGSQLQLSERLGLNRNTLRKKIVENEEYL